VLAAICITQLIREGMPVCYGGICHAFDMRTAQIIFGGPEQAIFSVAMCQMGKFYGFPVYINAGLTDSMQVDAQASLECGITLSLGIAAGADIFGHMGICGMDQGSSLDMLIMQSEIISYLESVNRNLSFDEDAFAIDIISEIGPKGTFLTHKHTRSNFKKQLWLPTLLNRRNFEDWIKKGSKGIGEQCRQRKEEIISNYKPKTLQDDILNELELMVKKAKKELSS